MAETQSAKEAWSGQFGDSYISRNMPEEEHLQIVSQMWEKIWPLMEPAAVSSYLEVGANIGNNVRVLSTLTDAQPFALEPNQKPR